MKTLLFAVAAIAIGQATLAYASEQRMITGSNPQEIQENAFKAGYSYPVSALKCDQRCSQWWER